MIPKSIRILGRTNDQKALSKNSLVRSSPQIRSWDRLASAFAMAQPVVVVEVGLYNELTI